MLTSAYLYLNSQMEHDGLEYHLLTANTEKYKSVRIYISQCHCIQFDMEYQYTFNFIHISYNRI